MFIGRGQDYVPMLDADVCWGRKYVDNVSLPPIIEQGGLYYIFLNSTEMISGVEYINLFNEYDPVEQDEPIGYLRENMETQQVFYLNVSEEFSWLDCEGEEILLYDFSAQVGDTVYHCPNSDLYYVVQSVETVEQYTNPEIDFFDTEGGRVYEVYSSEFNFSTIYEGVGSNIGPIHEPHNLSVPGIDMLANHAFGCAFILDTDESIKKKVEIFPNPVQNILNIKIGEGAKLAEVEIYCVSGQVKMTNKLSDVNLSVNIENLPNGLYFITGYDEKGRQIFSRKFVKMN